MVPLLCFDCNSLHRIGFGGGYYDATINYFRNNNKFNTIFIGLALEL